MILSDRFKAMFFDDVNEISRIAKRVGVAVFVVPNDREVNVPGAIILKPEDKTVITIEQIRDVISRLSVRQTEDLFILINPAEKLGEDAANALLKTLEEPGERVHFILVTDSPSSLLPTVLSRAEIYYLRLLPDDSIHVDEKVKILAKRLLVAKGSDLVEVAEEITRKKDGVRSYALSIVGTAIEMLYKSYFITGKDVFISKLPKFLSVYDAIFRNGHVKLQIVAGLA